jgi:DNA repair exonuclease SbcCD ATPase subunit
VARVAKTAATPAKPNLPARKSVSRPGTPTKKAATAPAETPAMKTPRVAAKMSRSTPAPARTSTTTPTAAPKLRKDELRAQIAKLEGSNATLKAKSRDMNRTIKAANNRIAELEIELAELREQASAAQAVAKPVKEAKAPRAARTSRKAPIDPGDAVPPGVAVEDPQPLDEEAQTARDALEEHLSGG